MTNVKANKTLVISLIVIGISTVFFLYSLYINGWDAIYGLTLSERIQAGAMQSKYSDWRIVTALFTHGYFGHYAINMILLLSITMSIRDSVTWKFYTFVLLVSGLISNIIAIYTSNVVMCGLSPAIFGLLAIDTIRAFLYFNREKVTHSLTLIISAILLITTAVNENMNNTLHYVGFTIGLICGIWLFRHEIKEKFR